jgi:hypothetical protein
VVFALVIVSLFGNSNFLAGFNNSVALAQENLDVTQFVYCLFHRARLLTVENPLPLSIQSNIKTGTVFRGQFSVSRTSLLTAFEDGMR